MLSGCATSAGDAAGVWGEPDTQGQPSLTLAEDGTLSGTDGCNRLMGTWTADEEGVAFGAIASTEMFCFDVDTWLSTATRASVSGDLMTLFDEGGTEVGSLARATATPTTEP